MRGSMIVGSWVRRIRADQSQRVSVKETRFLLQEQDPSRCRLITGYRAVGPGQEVTAITQEMADRSWMGEVTSSAMKCLDLGSSTCANTGVLSHELQAGLQEGHRLTLKFLGTTPGSNTPLLPVFSNVTNFPICPGHSATSNTGRGLGNSLRLCNWDQEWCQEEENHAQGSCSLHPDPADDGFCHLWGTLLIFADFPILSSQFIF